MACFRGQKSTGRTTCWHASPKADITKFAGHALKQEKTGKTGLYVAPTYLESIAWAASYVMHKKKGCDTYRNLSFYKLSIPREILNKAWKNDGWQKEFFIEEKHFSEIQIISHKTLSCNEITSLYARHGSIRWDHQRGRVSKDFENNETNLSITEYKRLIKQYHEVIYNLDKAAKTRINELLNFLKRYHYTYVYEIKETLDKRDEKVVKSIIQDIESLLKC